MELLGFDHIHFCTSPYGICTKNIFSLCFLLIVLVCKLLSIPVYPEWWNNKSSNVAKGRSECTGDGPYLPWSFPIQWNRKCSKPCSYKTRNGCDLETVLPNRCNSILLQTLSHALRFGPNKHKQGTVVKVHKITANKKVSNANSINGAPYRTKITWRETQDIKK
jgi:hypothetical protein